MVEGGQGVGFALEALKTLLASGQLGRQNLQCHLALQGRVFSSIHLTHTACAELLNDLVVAYGLADHFLYSCLRKLSD
jgi:hypothetical protein